MSDSNPRATRAAILEINATFGTDSGKWQIDYVLNIVVMANGTSKAAPQFRTVVVFRFSRLQITETFHQRGQCRYQMSSVPDQTDAAYNRSALLSVRSAVGTVDSACLYTVARCVLLILGPSRFQRAEVYFVARQG